jgi:hypothetical protein
MMRDAASDVKDVPGGYVMVMGVLNDRSRVADMRNVLCGIGAVGKYAGRSESLYHGDLRRGVSDPH